MQGGQTRRPWFDADSTPMTAGHKLGWSRQPKRLSKGLASLAVTIASLSISSAAQAQALGKLPPVLWVAIGGAVVLFILLIAFIVAMLKKEATPKAPPTRRRSSSNSPENKVWRDTGKGRRARDATDVRVVDDDLPPITVMTGAVWADPDQPQAVPRQSSLIAAGVAQDTDSNVYKTGYNPFFRQNATEHIQVEEVADLVQQAELMLTLANYPAAISMLTRHIRDTESPSPKAWLMLFDLYIKTEREDQYTNLAKGFRIQFNADVPSWNTQKTEPTRNLEDYPRVMERICSAWNSKDIAALLNSLLFDDRGGSRAGFKLEAYADLIMLQDVIQLQGTIEREIEERREIDMKLQSKPLV